MKWQEKQLLYRDSPVGENEYKPVAFDSNVCLYTEKGKVVFEYLSKLWDVEPDTLDRTLSKDTYPPYIGSVDFSWG